MPPQEYAPAKVAFWAAAIPTNAKPDNREAAKAFISYLASAPVQLQMALNGNGPVRADTLKDPVFQKGAPYASASIIALENATQPLPIFEGTNQVRDIFVKEAVAAIVGKKPIDEALAAAETDIKAVIGKYRQ
jgi:multiple sugar transport system substrate-binding protein